jgi:hypothetical protein
MPVSLTCGLDGLERRVAIMNVDNVKKLCEMAMEDPQFRSEFMNDPAQALNSRDMGVSPEELARLLVIKHGDCETTQVSDSFVEVAGEFGDPCAHKVYNPTPPQK